MYTAYVLKPRNPEKEDEAPKGRASPLGRTLARSLGLALAALLSANLAFGGQVRVLTDPPGAEVYIGEVRLGTTDGGGLVLDLPAGVTTLHVKKQGFIVERKSVSVEEGPLVLQIRLRSSDEPAPAAVAASVSLAPAQPPISQPLVLRGSIIGTTDPRRTFTAPFVVSLNGEGLCVAHVGAPLYGSGICAVNKYEPPRIVISTEGPLYRLTLEGTLNDSTISGTYRAYSVAQAGLVDEGKFELSRSPERPLTVADILKASNVKEGETEYVLMQERDVVSLHAPDGRYLGRRLFLGPNDEPVVSVEDFKDGSRFTDAKTHALYAEWVSNGSSGYYVVPNAGTSQYFDRFMRPLGWTSVEVPGDQQRLVFIHHDADGLELFDKDLKRLNIRSGRTQDGRTFWVKTEGNVSAFYDERLNPLNWYAVRTANGSSLFASVSAKGKVRYFDAHLRELKRPGFWSKLAKGLAIGLMAYGQALSAASAAQATSPPPPVWTPTVVTSSIIPSGPTTTTTTTVGNFSFSTSVGPYGPSTITTQRIGNQQFISGYSAAAGPITGHALEIGRNAFLNVNVGGRQWTGSSQSIGNFTFHNLYGSQGQMITGTSQRIGNFIFTTIR